LPFPGRRVGNERAMGDDGERSARSTSLRDVVLNQQYSHPEAGPVQWGAIAAIILGVAVGAAALVLGSWWLAVPAAALVVAGVATGLATGTMERTEDY
jgi:predicted phage tail protein